MAERQKKIVFYGARWCPHCRRAKRYLLEHDIAFHYIDIDLDKSGAARLEKISEGSPIIPTIMINGRKHVNPDNQALRRLLGLEEKRRRRLFDVVIVGGGAAGLTAAIYLQREGFETVVLEKTSPGGNAALTENIENYPGFQDISGLDLMEVMEKQAAGYGAVVESGAEALSVSRRGNRFFVRTGGGTFNGRALILATGSVYRTLGIPGEEELIGSGVHFCATCDGPFYRDKTVIVIGGGNSALEEGLNLARYCRRVIIVNNKKTFSASAIYRKRIEQAANVEVRSNRECLAFEAGKDGRFASLLVRERANGREEKIEADGVFVFIGMTPNTGFLKGKITLDENGRILTKGLNETSRPGIFAAGDCRSGTIAQVASATGEGVVASYGAREYLSATG